jgi:putative FmdB family regulatory protein
MALYGFVCLACERRFEERRPMTASVDAALVCPSCGSDRLRRQFSFAASTGTTDALDPAPASGGCACGGACACRG